MKFRLLAFALLLSGGVSAQNPYISLQGANETAGGLTVAQPRTILAVDVTVEHDVTLSGPYARYAQKYLGSARSAHRQDRVERYRGADRPARRRHLPQCRGSGSGLDPRAVAHRLRKRVRALAAGQDRHDDARAGGRRAHRRRANLLAAPPPHRAGHGRSGENVFGEGLKAALEEIDRLEQSYLELFLGKRIVSTETRRYVVCPQADKKQYIVCRFSPAAGLLPDTDLSGDIVLLQIEPSGAAKSDLEGRSEGDAGRGVPRGRSLDLHRRLGKAASNARAVLPVFEFGRTINVALPRRK